MEQVKKAKTRKPRKEYLTPEDKVLGALVISHESFDASVKAKRPIFTDVMDTLKSVPVENRTPEQKRLCERCVAGIQQRFNNHLSVNRKPLEEMEKAFGVTVPKKEESEKVPKEEPTAGEPSQVDSASEELSSEVKLEDKSFLEEISNLFVLGDDSRINAKVIGVADSLDAIFKSIEQLSDEEEATQLTKDLLDEINGALESFKLRNGVEAIKIEHD